MFRCGHPSLSPDPQACPCLANHQVFKKTWFILPKPFLLMTPIALGVKNMKGHHASHTEQSLEVPRPMQYIPASVVASEPSILAPSAISLSQNSSVYPNIIPTYYIAAPGIPDLTQANRVATHAGFLVQAATQGQTTFLQQPVQVSRQFIKLWPWKQGSQGRC